MSCAHTVVEVICVAQAGGWEVNNQKCLRLALLHWLHRILASPTSVVSYRSDCKQLHVICCIKLKTFILRKLHLATLTPISLAIL